MFDQDFLIKLGFDVDTTELDKVRKEIARLKEAGKGLYKTKTGKVSDKTIEVKKQNALLRKQLQLQKEINRAKKAGMDVKSFVPALKSKKPEVIDRRLLELQKLMEEFKVRKPFKASKAKVDKPVKTPVVKAAKPVKTPVTKPVKTPVVKAAKPVKTPVTKPVKTPVVKAPVTKPVKTPVVKAAKPVKTPDKSLIIKRENVLLRKQLQLQKAINTAKKMGLNVRKFSPALKAKKPEVMENRLLELQKLITAEKVKQGVIAEKDARQAQRASEKALAAKRKLNRIKADKKGSDIVESVLQARRTTESIKRGVAEAFQMKSARARKTEADTRFRDAITNLTKLTGNEKMADFYRAEEGKANAKARDKASEVKASPKKKEVTPFQKAVRKLTEPSSDGKMSEYYRGVEGKANAKARDDAARADEKVRKAEATRIKNRELDDKKRFQQSIHKITAPTGSEKMSDFYRAEEGKANYKAREAAEKRTQRILKKEADLKARIWERDKAIRRERAAQSKEAQSIIGFEENRLRLNKNLSREAKATLKQMKKLAKTFNGLNTHAVNRDMRHLNRQLKIAEMRSQKIRKQFRGLAASLGAIAPALMLAIGAFESLRAGHRIVVGTEQAMTQLEIAFEDKAQGIADNFVSTINDLGIGIGEVASLQAASQVLPALTPQMGGGEEGLAKASDAAKNLLWISNFTGQLKEMPAIARNFAQVATSLEQEDINQFADRFTALNPMILKQLAEMGKIETATKKSLIDAKTSGAVVSADWMAAFNKVMDDVTNNPQLRAKLASKYTVSHGRMLASVQEALAKFMGKTGIDSEGNELQKDSLTTALRNSYNVFSEALMRSGRLYRNIGEVFADVVDGLTTAALKLEEVYLKFAIWIRDLFGLTDDQAEQAIVWGVLTTALLPVIMLLGRLFFGLRKLLPIFSIVGAAVTSFGAALKTGLIGLLGAFSIGGVGGVGAMLVGTIKAWGVRFVNFFKKLAIIPIFINAFELFGSLIKGDMAEAGKNFVQLVLWALGLVLVPFTGGLSLLGASILSSFMDSWDSEKGFFDNLWDGLRSWASDFISSITLGMVKPTWGEDADKGSKALKETTPAEDSLAQSKMTDLKGAALEKFKTPPVSTKGKASISNSSSLSVVDNSTNTQTYQITESGSPTSTVKAVERLNKSLQNPSTKYSEILAMNGG